MVKYVSLALTSVFGLGALAGCSRGADPSLGSVEKEWAVVSPDNTITAAMQLESDGKLYYSVKKDGAEVVKKSEMGIDIEEDDFYAAQLCSVNTRRLQGEYENISGKRKNVTYDCNETVITLKGWSFYFDVTMRCYDDGYAFRYGIRKIDGTSGDVTIRDEKTQFALPEKTSIWAQEYKSTKTTGGDYFSYERAYESRTVAYISSSQQFAMPVMYKVDKDTYSIIAQSDLIGSGYYGSFLQVPEGKEGSGLFRTVINPAGAAIYNDTIAYPFESPWRVGITGDLKTVEESELVEKVYDDVEYWKPDNYETLSEEEKAIYDYDWVEPGACAWNWLYYSGKQNDYTVGSKHYQYVDLAAEMGWKYILLDGGWSTNLNETKFRAFADYATKKGVKIIVWCDSLLSFGKGNYDSLTITLDRYADLGISGIKPDFYDGLNAGDVDFRGEDIEMIAWYETMYQECAKRKMLVDCHGSNVPTGERRIYPNVINREAVLGNEVATIGAHTTINQLLIRGVVGPTDFTPVVNPKNSNLLTPAHQLALSFLFESGTPMYGDHIEAYDETVSDFYKSMPALRDETVFLDGKLDQLYSAAIRSGDQWLVGSVCYFGTDVAIDFSFLGDGDYTAEVITDGETGLQKEIITVTKSAKITKTLKDNGGVIFRLVPKN